MGAIAFRTGVVTTSDKVRAYFEYLFDIEVRGDEFPVDLDVVWPMTYTAKHTAKKALIDSSDLFEGEDYLLKQNLEHPERPSGAGGGGLNKEKIFLSVSCFEYFVARKSRPIFEIYRLCRLEVAKAAKAKSSIPYHLRRYLVNHDQVPFGCFSILQEITTKLIAPLEMQGYTLPDRVVPDISVGLIFCRWLREEKGIDTDSFGTYNHRYEDGRIVQAKLYPNELLPDFIGQFQNDWLSKRAERYFKDRDPEALVHLPKILKPPSKPDQLPAGEEAADS
jgi:hypothetical protein